MFVWKAFNFRWTSLEHAEYIHAFIGCVYYRWLEYVHVSLASVKCAYHTVSRIGKMKFRNYTHSFNIVYLYSHSVSFYHAYLPISFRSLALIYFVCTYFDHISVCTQINIFGLDFQFMQQWCLIKQCEKWIFFSPHYNIIIERVVLLKWMYNGLKNHCKSCCRLTAQPERTKKQSTQIKYRKRTNKYQT